ncbi:MAG TPA: class I SAM-dependent methyltransferase [Burkholderiales bacterium]|nr:class I SAM-dependent methyltransferase [Burkholderiales bacterium]
MDRRQFLLTLPALGVAPAYGADATALAAGEPSQTALGAASHRAVHQMLESPLVFEDPLALRILGGERVKWIGRNIDRYRTAGSRGMRAFLVTRARFAEDGLAQSLREGTRQYVVLGAGLDTFAYRNPFGARLRVFEVDHPATQAWKRAQLREQAIEVPRSMVFVPVDFETQSLAARLRQAGLKRSESVFVSWLGVTMYLTRDAVLHTLRVVAASCARGSRIVFDFSLPDEALTEPERQARAARAERVAAIGEPWISRFDPASLEQAMTAMGYGQARSIGAAEANERYFADRTDGFRFRGSSGRLMTARV